MEMAQTMRRTMLVMNMFVDEPLNKAVALVCGTETETAIELGCLETRPSCWSVFAALTKVTCSYGTCCP